MRYGPLLKMIGYCTQTTEYSEMNDGRRRACVATQIDPLDCPLHFAVRASHGLRRRGLHRMSFVLAFSRIGSCFRDRIRGSVLRTPCAEVEWCRTLRGVASLLATQRGGCATRGVIGHSGTLNPSRTAHDICGAMFIRLSQLINSRWPLVARRDVPR